MKTRKFIGTYIEVRAAMDAFAKTVKTEAVAVKCQGWKCVGHITYSELK